MASDERNDERWVAVDRCITETMIGHDAALDAAVEASDAAGLPQIAVAPNQGKLLHMLALIRGASTPASPARTSIARGSAPTSYFERALKLATPGALTIVDNVIREGAVADASSTDPSVLGVRRLNEMLRDEPRVTATTIQTVGTKGYDGLTIALVRR